MSDRRLRVCLLSENLTWPMDEGMKKFVHSLAEPLGQRTQLQVLTTRASGPVAPPAQPMKANRMLLGLTIRRAVRRSRPDLLVYVPDAAASLNSFVRCQILHSYAPRAGLVMISLQPRHYSPVARKLLPRLRPDLTLVQSVAERDTLQGAGCPAALIPSGIDMAAFQPVTSETKAALRARYGLPRDAFVVLHVGHQTRQRNVLLLNRIRAELGCVTVVAASTSTDVHQDVVAALQAGGTVIINRFVERIAELYQLADCYLFPVHLSAAAINMPLSVLEALACGVPVVTTRFGTLPVWLGAGPGIAFADTDDELVSAVRRLYEAPAAVDPEQVREQVRSFTWPAVADMFLEYVQPTISRRRPGADRGRRPACR